MINVALFAASPYQEKFWLDWHLEPASLKYNELFLYRLSGTLESVRLRCAFENLSHQLPLLKCCVQSDKGFLFFRMCENFQLPYTELPLPSSFATEASEIHSKINTPFNLTTGPLWRAALFCGDHEYYLAIVLHHIIIDGMSFKHLRQMISKFYNEQLFPLSHNQPSPADFSTISLKPHYCQQGMAYYQQHLKDNELSIAIPTMPMPPTYWAFKLDQASFQALCKRHNTSLFNIMATVFATFLYSYFDQQRFCLGYAMNMRKKEHAETFGSFVNLQLLPLSITGNVFFTNLLEQVIQSRHETRHLTLPYEQIIQLLKENKTIESQAHINVVISETDLNTLPLSLHNVEVASIPLPKPTLPFDIQLEYQYDSDHIHLRLGIRNDWFSTPLHGTAIQEAFELIVQWGNGLQPLLTLQQKLAQWPEQPAAALTYNQSPVRIEEFFQTTVKSHAHQVAVIEKDKTISYGELWALSQTIAGHLAPLLRADTATVGLHMQHGATLIASMLALFTLGYAYVPLRQDTPLAYLDNILDQSGISQIITDKPSELSANYTIAVIDVQSLMTPSTLVSTPQRLLSNELAYVLYTSGTTGTPKGVMITHSNIVNLILSCQPTYHFSSSDITPWFHSFAFDFSVWEIWSMLLSGGALLVLDDYALKSPAELSKIFVKFAVTVVNQTPTALKQWTHYLQNNQKLVRESFSAIRLIICGGEALHFHHVSPLLSANPPVRARIFNMYGITEDGIHSTMMEVTLDYLTHSKSIIGTMLPGKTGVIVNADGCPVPLGCPGTLFLAGFGIAKGYLNNPILSSQRFVSLSLSPEKARWLNTGDQVRMLPDGNLEYLGRLDHQIKLRGYRIDAQYIENQLSCYPALNEIKVLTDGLHLIAFFTSPAPLPTKSLRGYSKQVLPHYMIPDQWFQVGSMPRTLNQKIAAAPLLEIASRSQYHRRAKEYTDAIINQISKIWTQVLNHNNFDPEDPFFDCGGTSILLPELQILLEKQFQIPIPMIELFMHPTIASLSKRIKEMISIPEDTIRPCENFGNLPNKQ